MITFCDVLHIAQLITIIVFILIALGGGELGRFWDTKIGEILGMIIFGIVMITFIGSPIALIFFKNCN